MGNRILVIEDEYKVASFIKKGLEENGYRVVISPDGYTGRDLAIESQFDLIILDINLPDISGFEVCTLIREHNDYVPVLMLTALSSITDKLQGFETGADDYLLKPFEFTELLARIKALIKRSKSDRNITESLKIADLELNSGTKQVKRGNNNIELTAKEFNLLEYLLRNKGRVISRADIAEKIWNITFDTGTNVIDVYVSFLRNKIDKGFKTKLLHTVIGMGYVVKEED